MKKTLSKPIQQKIKPIPHFKNEDEEFEFWSTHDITDYFDHSKAIINPIFPNLKYSTKSVTVRLPEDIIGKLKAMANKQDVPYQSLMKIILHNAVREEMKKYKA